MNIEKNENIEVKEKLFQKKWFVVLMLFIFPPLGIFLMWNYKKFENKLSVVLTLVFGVAFLHVCLVIIAIITFSSVNHRDYDIVTATTEIVMETSITDQAVPILEVNDDVYNEIIAESVIVTPILEEAKPISYDVVKIEDKSDPDIKRYSYWVVIEKSAEARVLLTTFKPLLNQKTNSEIKVFCYLEDPEENGWPVADITIEASDGRLKIDGDYAK